MTGLVQRGVWLLGIAASALTLTMGLGWFWPDLSTDGRLGLTYIFMFAAFLFLFVLYQEYRFSRKSRYAEVLQCIHTAYREGLEGALSRGTGEDSDPQLPPQAREVCNLLAQAFSQITGTRCAVCIKIIDQDQSDKISTEPRLSVTTLCRDSNSSDRDYSKGDVTHWIDSNTDFFEIFRNVGKPKGSTFLENNLPSLHGYVNTSLEIYGEPKGFPIPVVRSFVRGLTWNLPYKSTIVAPISPIGRGQSAADNLLVGFLCVDSASTGVFRKRYDLELVRSFSAILHPMIAQWCEAVWDKQSD